MSESKRPAYRIVAKHKDSGAYSEVGVLWDNGFGGFNLAPQMEAEDREKNPKLPLSKVLNGKYWLNVFPSKDRAETTRRERDSVPDLDGDDEDLF